jgi:hypothetical protein
LNVSLPILVEQKSLAHQTVNPKTDALWIFSLTLILASVALMGGINQLLPDIADPGHP